MARKVKDLETNALKVTHTVFLTFVLVNGSCVLLVTDSFSP